MSAASQEPDAKTGGRDYTCLVWTNRWETTMWTRRIIGVVLCLAGIVWVGQGANLIGGSFMSGQGLWLAIGCVCLVAGLAMLGWALRMGRTSTT